MTDSATTPPPSAPTSRPWLWPAVVAVVALTAMGFALLVAGGDDSDDAADTTVATTAATPSSTSPSAPATTSAAPPPSSPATTAGGQSGDAATCPEFTENLNLPLRLCDQGMAVRVMQENLTLAGFAVVADGFFGPATEAAVVSFQTSVGLEADGIYGPDTSAAMETALETEGD